MDVCRRGRYGPIASVARSRIRWSESLHRAEPPCACNACIAYPRWHVVDTSCSYVVYVSLQHHPVGQDVLRAPSSFSNGPNDDAELHSPIRQLAKGSECSSGRLPPLAGRTVAGLTLLAVVCGWLVGGSSYSAVRGRAHASARLKLTLIEAPKSVVNSLVGALSCLSRFLLKFTLDGK